jgi:N-acetylglucosaminyldiphosphoundecaprenol N-acetyl-beta-D-mannosaminyltransferase
VSKIRNTIKILGVSIDNITEIEAGEITKELVESSNKTCKLIVAPNVEFVMKAQKDEEFFNILKEAHLATPDSIGIMLGAKLQGKKFKARIPGQAYFREAIRVGEKEGWTFYLLGGLPGIAEKTKENLLTIFPNIKIVGFHDGFLDGEIENQVIDEINSLQPNVLFVAMGAPKQEKWIYHNMHRLKVDVAAGQGGTFDYEAGRIKRAPKVIQKIGIEWLWRLILQPSRIIRMMALPQFVIKLLFSKDKTKGKFDK